MSWGNSTRFYSTLAAVTDKLGKPAGIPKRKEANVVPGGQTVGLTAPQTERLPSILFNAESGGGTGRHILSSLINAGMGRF